MTSMLVVPGWTAALAVLCMLGLAVGVVLLAASVRRTRTETERVLASAAADAETLREELDALEQQLTELSRDQLPEITVVDDREYVITGLEAGRHPHRPLPAVPAVPAVPTPVFVDIVLRESLIRTASLAAGLRRALSPEVRHRIRLEMKREVKRSRKQRKADLRQARREWEARQRAAIDPA